MKITGRKTILCILCLFIFLCGIGIGTLLEHPATRAQRLFVKNSIYIYDTQEKIDQWFRSVEKNFDDPSLSWSQKEYEDELKKFKKNIPVAVVGKIGIFHNNDTGEYHLVEHGFHKPIARLGIFHNGLEFRQVDSKVLENSIVPHATISFGYDKDGSYTRGTYIVQNKDTTIDRIYVDSKGTGQFDQMVVVENGKPVKYEMVGMTWTKKDKEISGDEEYYEPK